MTEPNDETRAEPRPRETTGPDESARSGEVDVLAMLEAMLFASPEPLTVHEISAAIDDLDEQTVEHSLESLARALRAPERGLRLEKVAGGYRLVTRPDLAEPLRALFRYRNRKRLTPAALDVLAIIAYAQPITAPEIQEIRGRDPSWALRLLLERKLVRIVGRKRVVGRPILYGTTREFLLHFGLDSLEDLPPVEAYGTQVVPSQQRLFPVTGAAGSGTDEDDAADAGDADELADRDEPPPPAVEVAPQRLSAEN